MTTPNRPGEFALIERFFKPLSRTTPFVRQGIGDDCAVLSPAADEELVLSVDTLVEGMHFPRHYAPAKLAVRSLAVCISDLAAAGAHPEAFTLALTAPELSESWLAEFSRVLAAEAERYGVSLVGGDTTRGPLTVSVQAIGCVPKGCALTRRAAQSGDDVYITGTTGDAAAGLAILQGNVKLENDLMADYLLQRFNKPQPRVQFGQALVGLANSVIDVSDGLLADLSHITRQSQVAAEIQLDAVPFSEALRSLPNQADALHYALAGGEDFELCFTAPAGLAPDIHKLAQRLAVPCTRIGSIVAGEGVRCIDAAGQEVLVENKGYDHFPQ